MAWLTEQEMADKFAAVLQLDDGQTLHANLVAIAADARNEAQDNIYRAMRARGYTAAQVDDWDSVEHFHRRIGLYLCGLYAKHLLTPDQWVLLEKMDRTAELATTDLVIDGVVVEPPDDEDAPVGFGRMESDSDFFTRDPRARGNLDAM